MGKRNKITDVWNKTVGNKGIGGWVGDRFKSPSRPNLDKSQFDISEQAKKYAEISRQQTDRNRVINQEISDALKARVEAGPSLANAQLRAAQDKSLAQTLSTAAQARRSTPLTQRLTSQAQQQAGGELATQNMGQALAEQARNQQAYGQQLGRQAQIGAEDITSGFNIAYSPETLQSQMGRALTQGDLQRNLAVTEQQRQIGGALLGAAGQVAGSFLKPKAPVEAGPAVPANIYQAPVNIASPYMQAQPIDASSDEQNKKEISTVDKKAQEFLDKLAAYQYEYKDASKPGTAPGKRFGVMAQDLEKSEMGKSIVRDTPGGKVIDTVQGFGAALAAQAELNKRLKALESRVKSRKKD